MNVVIVDDEYLAIEELVFQLSLCDDLHISDTFMDSEKAYDYIISHDIDIVFLDIQMPGTNGLKFAKKILSEKKIHVIFVTAYTEYAVFSYELNAVDYLLKPINNARLVKALEKVRNSSNRQKPQRIVKDFLLIYEKDVLKPIRYDDITYCRADDKHVEIFTKNQKFLYENTIGKLEEILESSHFFRCHRSFIINLKQIAMIEPVERSYLVKMEGSNELIPISRSNIQAFKKIMSI
ncbi:MAG: response regulator transcription factor [Clostridia bacterium]|nr:response regulator transcription factor [Clostridia bacterium]